MELKYTKTHEWVRIGGESVTVGITDYAQSELGDIVYVDLPTVGQNVAMGMPMASIESVKTVSEVYAPISGEVMDTNKNLAAKSETVNNDPYEDGWIVKIKMLNSNELDLLMTADHYEATLGD
ncbi:MAG: glycine cleavage system protein GcvH [Fimbriimonadaceae bacterium]